MFFRQLLNDDTACASYLLRLQDARRSSRSSTRTSTSSTTTSRSPRRRASPIVAVFETHVQADHVSGLPELVERTGATAYLPDGRRRRVRAPCRSPTARSSSSATPRSRRSPRRATPLAHHAYVVTDRTRGDEPWFVLTGDALLVGDAGRPDLHAHGEHTRRGDGAHAVPLADRAAADAARPPRCSTPRTTPARSAAAACRPTRPRRSASSAATTARCGSTPRTRSSRRWSRTSRRRPSSRPRSSPPTAPAGRSPQARVTERAASGSGCARTSRSSRCWSRSTPSSARWSGWSARRCR